MALLFPEPRSIEQGSITLAVNENFHISWDSEVTIAMDLKSAADRSRQSLMTSKHHYLSVRRGREFLEHDVVALPGLIIALAGSNHGSIALEMRKDARLRRENYQLDVPVDGSPARLTADSSLGAFRGLTTFEQLFYGIPNEGRLLDQQASPTDLRLSLKAFTPAAPYHIKDAPQFPWRGFMLDTSRNYFSTDTIKRTLNGLALVKLNVLHWHMTDSHSWPLSITGFEDLAEKGAYSEMEIYDEADIQEIVVYAAERGIDVIVEIDIPGHTASIHHSRPDLITGYAKEPWEEFAQEPPAGQLRFMDDSASHFVVSLLRGLVSLLPSPYFGTGGDEINERIYEQDEKAQSMLQEKGWNLKEALNHFMDAAWEGIKPKTPLVWQEMIQEHYIPATPDDAVVLVWRDSQDASAIVAKNHSIVHIPSDYTYLDLGSGGWIVPRLGEVEGDWHKRPINTWYKIYTFDPYKGIPDDQHHLVLGGESALWTETTDETNIDSKVWPRCAALAEVLWTGGGQADFPRDPAKALARFQDLRYRLVSNRIGAAPLQPQYCALRGNCNG